MNSRIVNYEPEMDEQLAELFNAGWAKLRAMPQLYPLYDKWPLVDAQMLAKWRDEGKLTQEGCFVSQADDGKLVCVFAVSLGDDDKGHLHLFTTHPDCQDEGISTRTLAAALDYLRDSGMKSVITDHLDSRCYDRNDFLEANGFDIVEPDEERAIVMVQQPEAKMMRQVVLPDDSYRIITWQDEYLDEWLRIRKVVFGGEYDEARFHAEFRDRQDFEPEGWYFLQHNDEFVGITGAVICFELDGTLRGGVIEWVATLPEYRGKGLGRALMHAALNHFYQNDIDPVTLITQMCRTAAVGLYESLGFNKVAELRIYRKMID